MKLYRYEWQEIPDEYGYYDNWGFDYLEAPNYRAAKKIIFSWFNKDEYQINYIAEVKYLKEEE